MKETKGSSSAMAPLPRRRSVSSLSPAKERHLLANLHPYSKSGASLRPPLVTSSSNKTKSCNLASGTRPPTKPPPLPRRSVAVSQEESCFVSAAGDVLVCRSREFAQLMGTGNSSQHDRDDSLTSSPSTDAMKWCDIECSDFPLSLEKSSLCNPWLTRAGSNTTATTLREEKKEDDTRGSRSHQHARSGCGGAGGLRGGGTSTYEWGGDKPTSATRTAPVVEQATRALGHLELVVATSPSNVASPRDPPLDGDNEEDDEEHVLSMPSFDYSHFGNGGNDMLPVSPVRSRSRRHSDAAEIDINLSLKLPQLNGTRGRYPTRSSSALPSINTANLTNRTSSDSSPAQFFHGVPTFLNSLSQVRIQQVSAHPRGSHVLMISAEALLFSYGLNDHGQLGIGVKSPPPGKGAESHRRYVWTPTIITPLLENGGKAITCAAGESHSLVVVSTEGRRVLKSQSPRNDRHNNLESSLQISGTSPFEMNRVSSSPPTMDSGRNHQGVDESEHSSSTSSTAESLWHHQLYGFGRNNFMKIGLVHSQRKTPPEQPPKPQSATVAKDAHRTDDNHQDEMEDVLLPHRVALHCTVWPEKKSRDDSAAGAGRALRTSRLPPQGIFALAASSEHSAALVRRATGDIELFTWGNAAYHALGIDTKQNSKMMSTKIAPLPTLVDRLSYSAKPEASNAAPRLLQQHPPEFPVDVSLGPYSSFVVTSRGRCLSFGISYDGMLGQGKNRTDVQEPTPIQFPSTCASNGRVAITAVSAGTGHVMALAKCGTVFTWGKNTDGRLGLGDSPGLAAATEDKVSDLERAIEWTPQELPPLSKIVAPSRLPPTSATGRPRPTASAENEYGPIVQVCAGLDCSIIVTACGKVLSCGKRSGRLGLGEVNADVNTPTPLFGGLSLWHRPASTRLPRRNSASPSPARNRPVLKRGMTTG